MKMINSIKLLNNFVDDYNLSISDISMFAFPQEINGKVVQITIFTTDDMIHARVYADNKLLYSLIKFKPIFFADIKNQFILVDGYKERYC